MALGGRRILFGPAFHTRKQAFNAWAVALDPVVITFENLAKNLALPFAIYFSQYGHEIFSARKDEDIRLLGVPISW